MLTNYAKEFRTFIIRGNVVDLAVGVVIGAAFGAIVKAVVEGLFMPVIGVLTGGINFTNYKLPLWGEAHLEIGLVIQAIISFVIIGFCLFLVVKAMNRLNVKEPEKPAELTTEQILLTEIRDLLKSK